MRGLVVGRYQPLHKGHQAVIQKAIEDCVNVVVGIGSASARADMRNPFTFEERKAMVEAVFGDRVQVVALPDINDRTRWVDHVLQITGPVEKVYGNHERDLELFEEANMTVVRTGLTERNRYEGATVRMKLAEGDPDWRRDVPPAVVPLLDRMEAGKRLRLLEARA